MLLETALSQFLTARRAAGKSPRTIEFYDGNIRRFIDYLSLSGITGSAWATPGAIEEYLHSERATGLSDRTILARYQALRALFNWLRQRKLITESPVDLVQEPKYIHKPPHKIDIPHFNRLIDAIPGPPAATWSDHRDRLLINLLFWTGLRLGEIAALSPADFDTTARLIKVRHGKGNKSRFVPFPAQVRDLIQRHNDSRPHWPDQNALFLSNNGYGGPRGILQREGIRQMLMRRCRQARIPYYNPHAFRHGFALSMLNAGGLEMGILSKLMGHTSVKITQTIYADWETAALCRAYDIAEAAITSDLKSCD